MNLKDIQRWLTLEEKHQLDLLIGSLVNHHMGTEFIVRLACSLAACKELSRNPMNYQKSLEIPREFVESRKERSDGL